LNQEILLELKNISKSVHGLAGSKVRVLDKIDFKIDKPDSSGQIISLLSASATELTSLLKIISGVEKHNEGEVLLSGKKYQASLGEIVYIPEHPSSFPWLDVKQNVEFAVNNEKNKVNEAISLVGLEGYETHFPDNDSLGFRFRISLARAIATGAKIILLNEPLKNLHGETKKEIFNLISELTKKIDITIIIASININDTLLISDKIFLMKRHPGRIADAIEIDKSKELNIHSDYFHSTKTDIEKFLAGYENNSLKL
jgi:ABC-type nitrate/sulfonate/bicarbonate transport system ATPase subunit